MYLGACILARPLTVFYPNILSVLLQFNLLKPTGYFNLLATDFF